MSSHIMCKFRVCIVCDTKMMRRRTISLLLVASIILGISVWTIYHNVLYQNNFYRTFYRTSKKTLIVHTVPSLFVDGIHFEIATTTAARAEGLSGRLSIPRDYAMLFVFTTDSRYGFWMKDMRVPIDIIWLSDIGRIVDIKNSVQPDTYPNVFYPLHPVKYVLEMRAGSALQRGWKNGTLVNLPLPYGKNVSH